MKTKGCSLDSGCLEPRTICRSQGAHLESLDGDIRVVELKPEIADQGNQEGADLEQGQVPAQAVAWGPGEGQEGIVVPFSLGVEDILPGGVAI